ncbi:hypothetical protein [Herbaspirillum huttiense]|uniref:hypothetical protein n=1 Tax=Herbaspirillum huttiense TaxID=863372 RepID=UPI0039AFC303
MAFEGAIRSGIAKAEGFWGRIVGDFDEKSILFMKYFFMNDLGSPSPHSEIDIAQVGNFIGLALQWEDNQGYALALTDEIIFYL